MKEWKVAVLEDEKDYERFNDDTTADTTAEWLYFII